MRLRHAALALLGLLALIAVLWMRAERERGAPPAAPLPSGPTAEIAPAVLPELEAAATGESTAVDLEGTDPDLDLCGRVIDSGGAPVPGARIECLAPPKKHIGDRDPEWPVERDLLAETRSASDGSFSFRLARGDLCSLRVSHSDYAPTVLDSCLAGERVEVVLHAASRIVVFAHDLAGEPVLGAEVQLAHRGEWGRGGGRGEARRGETDERGLAEFASLAPGRMSIDLAHDSLHCPRVWDVVLSPGDAIEVPVLLREGRSISGTVRDRETGLPIAGARVIDGVLPVSRGSTTSDEEGRYTLNGVEYLEVSAAAEGYGQSRLMLPETIAGPIDFELPPGDTAVGTVVDESGSPLVGIEVVAMIPGMQPRYSETRRGTTAEDGSFRIDSLHPEGPHTLIVSEPPYALTHRDFDGSLRRPDGVIDLGTIVLRPGRTIEGEFVDSAGEPIPFSTVAIFGGKEGSSASGKTDRLGRFRFPGLASGEYWVTAHRRGWPAEQTMVRLADEDPLFVRLVLPEGGELEITLVTPEGDPVPCVRVSVSERDEHFREKRRASATTDEGGIARLGGVSGRLHVRLDFPRGYLHRVPFDIEPVGGAETIVVERAATVSGIVVSPEGAPMPRMHLRIIERVPSYGHEGGRLAKTALDGTFELELAPGAGFDLECPGVREEGGLRSPSTRHWTGLRGMMGGLVAPVEGLRFRLEPVPADRGLAVRVVGPAGEPIEGAMISPNVPRYEVVLASVATDADGLARFDGLPAILLRVLCKPPKPPPGSTWSWLPPGGEMITPGGQECLFTLDRGIPLAGVVVDEEGAPLDGAVVTATTSRGRQPQARCYKGSFEIVLLEGETASLEAVLPRSPGGTLRGALGGVAAGSDDVRIVVRAE